MEKYTRTDCPIHGTKYCKAVNMPSCDKCILSGDAMETIRQDLDELEKLIPEGGMGQFYNTGRCVLCKGEKAPAAYYATADLGNPDPPKTGRNVIGMKTKLTAGSIVTLQLSCCEDCRRKHAGLSGKENIYTLMVAAVVLALLNITPIAEGIAAIASFLPLLLFAAAVGGTWLWGRSRRKKRMAEYAGTTYLRVFDIPGVDEMEKKGWFEINPYKDMSKLMFSKEPLKQGLYTGEWEEGAASAENI